MATTQESTERKPGTEERTPPRTEEARVRAYLDLWERHIALSAVDGPIVSGFRRPA